MLIYSGLFSWEGFGGLFNLAAGTCRLWIVDLSRSENQKVTPMKPLLVIASDLSEDPPNLKKVTVRSCCSHIATRVSAKFNLDPQRMTFVEFIPGSTYGDRNQFVIDDRYECAEFQWHDGKALHPRWTPLSGALLSDAARAVGRRTS